MNNCLFIKYNYQAFFLILSFCPTLSEDGLEILFSFMISSTVTPGYLFAMLHGLSPD